jgi:MFS family permease
MGMVAAMGLSLTAWRAVTPAWMMAGTLVVLGLGMGLTQSPTANAVTLVVGKERLGVALGIFNMLRFVAGTLGQTIFGSVLDRAGGPQAGLGAFRLDFVIFAVVAAAAAALALRMPTAARVPAAARQTGPGFNPAGD